MPSVLAVAKYITKAVGPVSTMKLQKLVYYSQAWHLVWAEQPIFPEKIQAWANGPVVKELFNFHKGRFSINEDSFKEIDDSKLSVEEKDSIDKVIGFYNKFSSQELSTITHLEQPWQLARKRAGVTEGERSDEEITLVDMAEYYESL